MLRRFTRPFVAIALVLSIGLHWPILQSVAWMSMLVSFSRQDGMEQAISKTFDGKHPCKLCTLVAEGKKAEKSQKSQISLQKLDAACLDAEFFIIHPDLQVPSTSLKFAARLRTSPPPRHPPDFA